MNPDLYTDEFRDFKFLKSPPDHVSYFKKARRSANSIRPQEFEDDPNFEWVGRIEFLEQILDLRQDTLYIVFAGLISFRSNYENSDLIEIDEPVILDSNPIVYTNAKEVTLEQVSLIENNLRSHFCLIEGRYFVRDEFNPKSRILDLNSLPVVPFAAPGFTEMFNNKTDAENYQKTLTQMLRKKLNAISSFSSRI